MLSLSGLSVQTTHLPSTQVTFAASGLSDKETGEISFMHEGSEIDLVQYYLQKYERQLQCPRLPCVVRRQGPNVSYFPIEVLVIV